MIWLGVVAILLIVLGPTLWVQRVMALHGTERSDFPGTGGELARHLLDQFGLKEVPVEITEIGDHYDTQEKAVRLTQQNHDGRSITAVAVAAHEVAHATQDRDGFGPLKWRDSTVRTAAITDRIGSIALFALSALGGVVVGPKLLLLGLAAVIVMGLVRVIANLITLPVETDASFNRALPILAHGGYLHPDDMPAARSVLRAAAFTYVAGSLMQLLNFFRFLHLLR